MHPLTTLPLEKRKKNSEKKKEKKKEHPKVLKWSEKGSLFYFLLFFFCRVQKV
jgi:hypothetical protein